MPEPIYLALQVKDCAALCQFFAWIEREVLKGLRVGFFLMGFFYFLVVFSGRGKIVKTEMLGLISTCSNHFQSCLISISNATKIWHLLNTIQMLP